MKRYLIEKSALVGGWCYVGLDCFVALLIAMTRADWLDCRVASLFAMTVEKSVRMKSVDELIF